MNNVPAGAAVGPLSHLLPVGEKNIRVGKGFHSMYSSYVRLLEKGRQLF